MAYVSEIEKLERRWAENPLGLTFAPLAEAYRKGGDAARALDLLRTGLDVHPDYIPASIVLGRCHMDLGDDAAAESAFERVLALDAENVIALKALADVAERQDRPAAAARWLERLLSVDRANEDAREQLQRVSARLPAEPVAAVPAAPEPPPAPAPEPAPLADVAEVHSESAVDLLAGHPVEAYGADLPELEEGPGVVGVQDTLPVGATGFEPEPLPVAVPNPLHEPSLVEPPVAAVAVAIPADLMDEDVAEAPPSPDAPLPEAPLPEAPPPAVPVMAEEPVAVAAPLDVEAAGPVEDEALEEPVVPDGEDWSAPVPVLTETMAELYLRQGHVGPALAVYRHLAEQHPDEPRFAARIAELAAAAAPSAPAEEPGAPAAPTPVFAAAQTGGVSVGEFFAALAAGRAPVGLLGTALAGGGEAAAGPASEGTAAPPVAESPPSDALSFDDFFRADTLPADQPGGGPGRPGESPEPSEFQAWLRTLRS